MTYRILAIKMLTKQTVLHKRVGQREEDAQLFFPEDRQSGTRILEKCVDWRVNSY